MLAVFLQALGFGTFLTEPTPVLKERMTYSTNVESRAEYVLIKVNAEVPGPGLFWLLQLGSVRIRRVDFLAGVSLHLVFHPGEERRGGRHRELPSRGSRSGLALGLAGASRCRVSGSR